MQQTAHQPVEQHQLLFLPSVFNETLDLLFDAHNYFQSRGLEEQSMIPAHYRPLFSHEMSRITTRLTSIMAWVMVRKAVCTGRIEEEMASENYRLDIESETMVEFEEFSETLPYYIGYLSERTRELYERVERLDSMVYGPKETEQSTTTH